MKKILIAPNAFKHSLSAIEIAKTIKSSLDSLALDFVCEISPIADGGDGTTDVFKYYFPESSFVEGVVYDPLMRRIKSSWLRLNKETAVIELAKASGLALLKNHELNPPLANTIGTGELILYALNRGCRTVIIALGGSATIDAGCGILSTLGVKITDKSKNELKPGAGSLSMIENFDMHYLDQRIPNCKIEVLCDVQSTLVGKTGTVFLYSAQKGANKAMQVLLEENMNHFADVVFKHTGKDYRNEPMVGAAGGVAFSLMSLLGGELYSGFSYMSKFINLEEKVKNADLILTGEGHLDEQTLMGKGVIELVKLAKKCNKNVMVLCGGYDEGIDWKSHDISHVIKIKPDNLSLAESLKNTKDLIENAIKNNKELFINC